MKSKKVDRYYIGSTDDSKSRVQLHNSSRARWTKRYQPWELVHCEDFQSRAEAVRREKYLKSLKGIGRYIDKIKAGMV